MDERETDNEIVSDCRDGDRRAFAALYDRHQRRVFSVALNFFGGDRATAEDVTQSVFLKLFDKLGSFRAESSFSTWIYRLTTNACLDEARRGRRVEYFGDDAKFESTGADGAAEIERRERTAEVRRALASIDEKFRIPMILKFSEGLSYDEIAAVLDCSAGTVASRLSRGQKKLAEKLGHLRGTV